MVDKWLDQSTRRVNPRCETVTPRRRRTTFSRALLAIALLLSTAVPVRANAAASHPSGLEVVGPQVFQAAASNDDQASRFSMGYNDGTWVRNAVEGTREGDPCPTGGDSGGPVFTIYGDGVAAKGIHSGGGKPLTTCYDYFTDIQHPIQALPGG